MSTLTLKQEASQMEFAKTIFLLIHVASVLGMLVLLLLQTSKPTKVIPKGFMHAALTALVAGFALVGINSSLEDDVNHLKVGVKFLVLVAIMILGYQNQNKPQISKGIWVTLLGLTVFNVFIAVSI
jgi:peptidoglycan/LPS O-acetylase OafA/YrhL